jgi:uncharacterized membrane protein (DUF373 family)
MTAMEQDTPAPTEAGRPGALRNGVHGLEMTDSAIYLVVGVCFLIAAALSLIFDLLAFVVAVGDALHHGATSHTSLSAMPVAIIDFVSGLLLTLIILEVMSTVVSYLKTHATSLKPFLFIGIISAVRGILAAGARLTVGGLEEIRADEFRNLMIELGVNALVIVALGVTLRIIGRYLEDKTSDI